MEALPWFWFWVILAAALSVGEMLTTSFFLLPFALGAAVAAVIEALGGNLLWQWLAFVVLSVIALILFRPLAKRITNQNPQRSGVDRLIGTIGKVIEGQSLAGENRARVGTEVWNVVTEDGSALSVGCAIEVVAVEGAHLIVRTIEQSMDQATGATCTTGEQLDPQIGQPTDQSS